MRLVKVTSAFGLGLLLLFAVASPGAATVIPLPLSSQPPGQPVIDMDLDVGVGTGGCCLPSLNPYIHSTPQNPTGVLSVMTPAGAGVQFDTISTTSACCTCVRMGTSIPLIDPTNGSRLTVHMLLDNPRLQGYAEFHTSPFDFYTVPSFGVELLNDGVVMQSVLFTAQTATFPSLNPINNCGTAFNLTNLIFTGGPTSGMFDIPLAAIPGIQNVEFDEIKVYLMGYGCDQTHGASVTVGGLQLAY
jgi:hypothetical protein